MLRIASIAQDYYPRLSLSVHASLLGLGRAWYLAPSKVSPHPVVLPNIPTPPLGPDYPLAIGHCRGPTRTVLITPPGTINCTNVLTAVRYYCLQSKKFLAIVLDGICNNLTGRRLLHD